MPKSKFTALLAIVLITAVGLFYKEATAQETSEEISQLEKCDDYLKTGNYKVTAIVNYPGEDAESWVNNINYSSYYLSNGQLMRIDAHSTGTSVLFLESGTYLLDGESNTYNLYTDKTFYPEIIVDLEKNSPEILQIYNIFLKSIEWVEYEDYMWESGEPVIVNNNEDIKRLKIWMFLSETEPIIENLMIIDENNTQKKVNLRYEKITNEEFFEALNFTTYSASLL